ncbi:IclR family transcriptional regulator [Raineyella fluvialis]|uniref:Helix-turn-helix domain-containing protein n=1 Tax=Raineyella fluvialis TaxID=2662261 RepID=A0A5Q2FCH7_9ACTN|nr:IclR family transcriptional regulator [Raineyella fluvialis]QGF22405.1 helix-turn-helix domain-containing protein [Raineyella fluvialis]
MTVPIPATAVPTEHGRTTSTPSILSKAFLLLECFSAEDRVLTFTELVERSGLPKSTVHRLLSRLMSLDIIEGHDRAYRIGMRLFAITTSMPASNLRDLCLPHLARLNAWSGTTVHLAVLRGVRVAFVERLTGRDELPAPKAGDVLPAHGTALGKALLAWLTVEERDGILPDPLPRFTSATITDRTELERQLQAVRHSNIALDLAEWHPGVYSAASALVVHRRQVGAIAVSTRSAAGLTDELKAGLLQTARTLSEGVQARIDAGEAGWTPVEDIRP